MLRMKYGAFKIPTANRYSHQQYYNSIIYFESIATVFHNFQILINHPLKYFHLRRILLNQNYALYCLNTFLQEETRVFQLNLQLVYSTYSVLQVYKINVNVEQCKNTQKMFALTVKPIASECCEDLSE